MPMSIEGRPDRQRSLATVHAALDAGVTLIDTADAYHQSVGALRDLLDEGKIQMAGISNANPDRIRVSQEILGGRLVSVQNQFSPAFQSSRPELELCDQLGIAFLPWSPLGGITRAAALGSRFAPFQ